MPFLLLRLAVHTREVFDVLAPHAMQEAIYSAEKDVGQMSSRVQREQEDLQRRAASLADTGLKQEAESQRLQMERRSWQEGEAERLRLDAAARESKQQAQHLKVQKLIQVLTAVGLVVLLSWIAVSDHGCISLAAACLKISAYMQ